MILFGYKGCGKTYFGKFLAQELALRFIDTDDLIESLYHPKMSCRSMALALGEAEFRVREKKVIHQLDSIAGAVLSVGGGAVLDADNRRHLSSLGPLVYLEIDKETLKRRLLYRNNLKNREFDKEASQNSHLERATIVRAQGASEEENFEKKPTPSKTDSSGCFGIKDELPSYLDPNDPEGSFEKMYEERKKIYENSADITITLCGKKERAILEELRSYYEQYIWHNL